MQFVGDTALPLKHENWLLARPSAAEEMKEVTKNLYHYFHLMTNPTRFFCTQSPSQGSHKCWQRTYAGVRWRLGISNLSVI